MTARRGPYSIAERGRQKGPGDRSRRLLQSGAQLVVRGEMDDDTDEQAAGRGRNEYVTLT
ncbi:hypothetical protein G9464_02990 [Halostella sp. JP-L12]|uniref:hypothetical protein n=1 Tax=Halostella TaxID=1843185 RepID=UPI0013CE73B4|nr:MULTISPECIES: hypothetical protein [Halostella]NHN46564.1 hypothetical protein [Halostella sp. JP-L12]